MSSYIKFLSRNKLYSIIEAVGLAVSLAFVVIIFCYVAQHIAVTRENPHRKEIYGVAIQDKMLYQYGMKETIGESIPEIKAGQVLGCDRDFFDFFPVQFAEGQPDQIDETLTAFVSEEMAQTLSQSGEVVGRTIHMLNHDFTVVGVYTDLGTSLFYAMPDVIVNVDLTDGVTYYGGFDSPAVPANIFENVWLFIKTFPDVDREALCGKLATATEALYLKILGREYPVDAATIKLVRLDEVFYYDGQTTLKRGDKVMMHSLLAVGLLLLISALFNYINLNVALTSKRAKEMATRRLHGATKGRIIGKYLLESLAFTLVCMVLGILMAKALEPLVNRLLGDDVGVKIMLSPFYCHGGVEGQAHRCGDWGLPFTQ